MARRRLSGGRLPIGSSVRPSAPPVGVSTRALIGSVLELEDLSTIEELELLLLAHKPGGGPHSVGSASSWSSWSSSESLSELSCMLPWRLIGGTSRDVLGFDGG